MSPGNSYVIFLRHGDAEVPSEVYPDHHRMGLSSLGRQQADRVAESLASLQIDRLVSSPLPRALQTAEPLVQDRPLKIEIEPRLEERVFRPFYGKRYDRIAAEHGREVANAIARGDSDILSLPGVDDLPTYSRRVRTALDAIGSHRVSVTLVVSHGGPHEWYLGSLLSGSCHFQRRWFALGKCRASVFAFEPGNTDPARIMGVNLEVLDAKRIIEADK
jgi:broad specificity phosphatase PhoE